jgi:DNA-nicking Smr family endonuclease
MDFGEILEAWEKRQNASAGGNADNTSKKERALMEKWLASEEAWKYYDKGEEFEDQEEPAPRSRLRRLPPEAHLDLHGLTRDEALRRLDRFIKESVRRELKKVLIIHGKGNHSREGAVLRNTVQEYLRDSPLAGETGNPGRELGGSGATWVLLKNGKPASR